MPYKRVSKKAAKKNKKSYRRLNLKKNKNRSNKFLKKSSKSKKGSRKQTRKQSRKLKKQRGGYTTTAALASTNVTKCVKADNIDRNSLVFQDTRNLNTNVQNENRSLSALKDLFFYSGTNGAGSQLYELANVDK